MAVELTHDGRALIEAVMPDSRAIYAMVVDRFGQDKVNALLDLLAELEAINTDIEIELGV